MSHVWKVDDKLEPITLELDLKRAIMAVAGTRDFYPFHHNAEWAKENGADDIFFNTMFLQGFAGRAVNEWFGHDAFLRKLDIGMRASVYKDRTLKIAGTVKGVQERDGATLLEVDAMMSTEDGPTTAVKATVQLGVPLS
ncbi:MAG: hypothetical protein V3V67_04720 [Myxococcota bacterium]